MIKSQLPGWEHPLAVLTGVTVPREDVLSVEFGTEFSPPDPSSEAHDSR